MSPAQPKIVTTAQPASGTVPVALNDKATLSGGVGPTGTITFNLYGAGDTSCKSAPIFTVGLTVTGNGDYTTTTGPTVSTAGTYEWVASYGGDANNLTATTSCGDEPVVVSPAQPKIVTTPSSGGLAPVTLTDSATLSGGVGPTGTITFNLYGPNDTSCKSAAIDTETATVSGDGTYATPSGFSATQGGTYEWVAVYGGDANNLTATSGCGNEAVVVTVPQSQLTPTGTTCQQFTGGTAQTQQLIFYSLNNGKIASNINPGVFFYYTNVTAPSASFTIDILQTTNNTADGGIDLFAVQNNSSSQIILYNADCTNSNLGQVTSTAGGHVVISVTGATAGQKFIVSVKYSAKSIVGDSTPSPANAEYDWATELNNTPPALPGTAVHLNLSLQ